MWGMGVIETVFFLAAMLALLFLTIIGVARLDGPKKSRDAAAEETRTIQEINRGLQRMEERIESLETILMDHSRARSERAHTKFD